MIKPKLVLFDVDGVLTDGRKQYDQSGSVVSKFFADLDFTAIKAFKCLGVNIAWVSGDSNVNRKVAESRSIPFYFTREHNVALAKAELLARIEKDFSVTREEMWFVGDDVFDSSMAGNVGLTLCLSNSPSYLKNKFDIVIPLQSGEFVALWVFEFYLQIFGVKFPSEEQIAAQESGELFRY